MAEEYAKEILSREQGIRVGLQSAVLLLDKVSETSKRVAASDLGKQSLADVYAWTIQVATLRGLLESVMDLTIDHLDEQGYGIPENAELMHDAIVELSGAGLYIQVDKHEVS